MRIQATNNIQTFKRIPVLKCKIEDSTGKPQNATLFEMEPNKQSDAKEIRHSKNARCIYYDFMDDAGKHKSERTYYLLKNDKTQEVVACAQTARHIRPTNAEYSGHTTFIEEMAENPKYIKGGRPLFAHIALDALASDDDTVSTSDYTSAIDSLQDSRFVQIKTGDWILPKEEYKSYIKEVMGECELEYAQTAELNAVG